jgi:hypothetical protein
VYFFLVTIHPTVKAWFLKSAAADTLSAVSEYGYIDDGYLPPESDLDIDITAPGISLPAEYILDQDLPLQS